ncbi:hypothetical protein AcW1_004459 [Taiwanofungus camphoratus]|nr:hypothetical protein AcW1_004459 [Antrodia cinnamomea]
MRCCPAGAARILTLFSLAILSAHSFTRVNAQSSVSSSDPASLTSVSTSPPSSTPDPSSSIAASSESASSFSVPSTSVSQSPSSSTPDSQPSSSQDVTSSSASSFSPSISSSSVSPTSSTPFSSSQSSSSSFTSSSSSAFSSSLSSSSSSSSSVVNSVTTSSSASTLVVAGITNTPAPVTSYYYMSTAGLGSVSSASSIQTVSGVVGAASTSSPPSSKGFLENKGAVAGTFTVVGLLVAGGVVAIVMYVVRHRKRLRDDEDAVYFEKDNGHNGYMDSPYAGGDNPSVAEMMTPAASDAYPDRTTHYGIMSAAEDDKPRDSIVEYARGTAYAAARVQAGPYQYTGQPGGYGGGYTNMHYAPQPSVSPGTHPFADPNNLSRPGRAPPVFVNGVEQPFDSYYGQTGGAHQVEAQ